MNGRKGSFQKRRNVSGAGKGPIGEKKRNTLPPKESDRGKAEKLRVLKQEKQQLM